MVCSASDDGDDGGVVVRVLLTLMVAMMVPPPRFLCRYVRLGLGRRVGWGLGVWMEG